MFSIPNPTLLYLLTNKEIEDKPEIIREQIKIIIN